MVKSKGTLCSGTRPNILTDKLILDQRLRKDPGFHSPLEGKKKGRDPSDLRQDAYDMNSETVSSIKPGPGTKELVVADLSCLSWFILTWLTGPSLCKS